MINGKSLSEEVILYPSVDHVEQGKSYLLILQYRPQADRYVVADGNSQILIKDIAEFKENKATIELTYSDAKGNYTYNDLKELINKL